MVLETRVPTIDASVLELDLYMAVRFFENMASPILMQCIRSAAYSEQVILKHPAKCPREYGKEHQDGEHRTAADNHNVE